MMRFILRPALATLFVLSLVSRAPAQEAAPTPAAAPEESGPRAEFQVLFEKIGTKLKGGQATEAALVDELKEFDALIAKYHDRKDEDVAMIAFMRARLYLEVFENLEKAVALLKAIKADFPDTEVGRHIDEIVASVEKEAASRAALAVGQPFPEFAEKDLDDKPLALANYKGKVVLVDFWATWCGPCVAELPNVIAAYEKFHGKGFEIVGISLDKERDKLTGFIKERNMSWPQYFDGLGWDNKLGKQYGISSIPATFLLDKEGKIAARDLRGDELAKKLGELLGE